MNTQQLSLFVEPSDRINQAIAKLTGARGLRPNAQTFVSQLGSLMTANPPGSLIIAAVPNGPATEQTCDALERYLEQAKARGFGHGKASIATLEIPHVHNRRMLQRQIPDLYTSLPASKIGHVHKPQFLLDFSPGYVPPTPMQQICGLLRARAVEYYLVSKAHYLSPSGSSVADGINQVRFFIQLASQSKRTHVLFTNAGTAREWLGSGEITNEVSSCWLRPYNRADSKSFAEFKGLLKGYDLIAPREDGFTLLSNAKQIYDAVWGCTYRLHKWVINSLISVQSRGGEAVSWSDFCQCAPSAAEIRQAEREFEDIKAMSSPLTATLTLPTKAKSSTKPGQRSLGRDRAGHDFAAA